MLVKGRTMRVGGTLICRKDTLICRSLFLLTFVGYLLKARHCGRCWEYRTWYLSWKPHSHLVEAQG